MAKAPKRMSAEEKAKEELGDAVLNKMGFHGPTKHSTNALERSKARTMAEYGDSYGSDSSIEDEVAGAMNDSPGGGYMEMPAKQAFAHIGLSKPSPQLMELWDSVAPAQRKGIVDAILSNVAAPVEDPDSAMVRDAEYNLGGDPDDDNDGMGPDGEGYSSERPVPGGDASYPTDDFQYDKEDVLRSMGEEPTYQEGKNGSVVRIDPDGTETLIIPGRGMAAKGPTDPVANRKYIQEYQQYKARRAR